MAQFKDPRHPGETWNEYDSRMKDVVEPETLDMFFDDGDGDHKKIRNHAEKLLIKIGFYRFIHWVSELPGEIKCVCQHVFSKGHISYKDLWSLDFVFAKWMYPRLKRFIASNRHGYPSDFSEYVDHEWKSREEYDKAISDGRIHGGGMEAWNKILNEMLFWFEWRLNYKWGSEKEEEAFCKKWGLKNPHAHIAENKQIDYVYKDLTPGMATMMSEESDCDVKEPDKYVFLGRRVMYYNVKYDCDVIGKRAEARLALFGKYLENLWD
jgi:hypothetical protein